jgi:uncharacterized membrane protein
VWGGVFVMIGGVVVAIAVGTQAASRADRNGVEAAVIIGYSLLIIGFFIAALGVIDYARRPRSEHRSVSAGENASHTPPPATDHTTHSS